jgi:hypothetical protein
MSEADPTLPRFQPPQITPVGGLTSAALLRADTEQQQQQQQQQQQAARLRRFLNPETGLPEEEVVTQLTTEVRQVNRLAPPGERRL